MERKPVEISQRSVNRATFVAQRWIGDALKAADELRTDVAREKRREQNLCKCCFYLRRGQIGGAAMTIQPCGICKTEVTYASTVTDVVCLPCASNNHLCKHCGADLALDEGRTFEPKMSASGKKEPQT